MNDEQGDVLTAQIVPIPDNTCPIRPRCPLACELPSECDGDCCLGNDRLPPPKEERQK